MFRVGLFFLLIVGALSFPYHFADSGVSIEIKGERDRTWFQISLTIHGGEGAEFILISEAFQHHHRQHKLTLHDGLIEISPEMEKQDILIRDKVNGKYHLAFRHEVGLKEMHFMPIRIIHNQEQHDFFLTTFDLSIPFLSESSFYRCDEVLISIQQKQIKSSGEQQQLQVTLFTQNLKEHNFHLTQGWNRTWRHYDDGVYFGGATKKGNIHDKLKVFLSSRKICQIDIDQLPQPGDNVDIKKYFQMKDLLKWAPSLPFVDLDDEL